MTTAIADSAHKTACPATHQGISKTAVLPHQGTQDSLKNMEASEKQRRTSLAFESWKCCPSLATTTRGIKTHPLPLLQAACQWELQSPESSPAEASWAEGPKGTVRLQSFRCSLKGVKNKQIWACKHLEHKSCITGSYNTSRSRTSCRLRFPITTSCQASKVLALYC